MNHIFAWTTGTRRFDFDFFAVNFCFVEVFERAFRVTDIKKLNEFVLFVRRFANFFDFTVDAKNRLEFVVAGAQIEIEDNERALILIVRRDIVLREEVLHVEFAAVKDERVHVHHRTLSVSYVIVTHNEESITRVNCMRRLR
jgi:hypothetical protein